KSGAYIGHGHLETHNGLGVGGAESFWSFMEHTGENGRAAQADHQKTRESEGKRKRKSHEQHPGQYHGAAGSDQVGGRYSGGNEAGEDAAGGKTGVEAGNPPRRRGRIQAPRLEKVTGAPQS